MARARKSRPFKDRPPQLRLRLSRNLSNSARQRIQAALIGLPVLNGSPIHVKALSQLTAHRGKLLSARTERGTPVHAASFIRRREIVFESELLRKPALPLIVVHEIFHFVWARLSNADRESFRALLAEEFRGRARGEVGDSAAVKKEEAEGVLTRDYLCESFCDTAAWLYAPTATKRNVALAQKWRGRRKAWFDSALLKARNC